MIYYFQLETNFENLKYDKKITSNSIVVMIQSIQYCVLSFTFLMFVCFSFFVLVLVYAIAIEASVATPHWLFLLRDIMMYPCNPQESPQEFLTNQ